MFTYIFLAIAGFLSQFIDAIAGGGGLISLPALLAIGIPTQIALGTNKLGAFFGTTSSTITYAKKGYCDFKLLSILAPFSLIGAVLGTKTVVRMDPSFLNPIIMVLIGVISLYTVFKKDVGVSENYTGLTKKTVFLGILLAFTLGFYDGFFGPGTGSFLIFGLIKIFGFDFIHASANSKFLNLASNSAALVTFLIEGCVSIPIGLFFAVFMIIGSNVGSKLAIKVGPKLIKPIFIIVSLLTMVKIGYAYF